MLDSKLTRRQSIALVGGLSAALAAGLAGCASEPGDEGSPEGEGGDAAATGLPGGRVVMGITVDPDGLDPHRTAAASTFEITANVFDTLVGVEVDGTLVPCLARDWDVSDDGLTLTFALREGATFSNGKPCDAAAVAASFARLVEPDSPRLTQYEGYTFEADGDWTLVVRMAQLNVAALTDFAYAWSAVVDASSLDASRTPAGTGPYVVASWSPQQSVVLEANPSYWGDAPAVGTVEFRVLPDATSQTSSLRSGAVDLVMASSEQVQSFEDDASFQLIQAPQNGVQLMAMNCKSGPLADVRVRRAINHAVNKDQLIESVWWGLGEKIGSHFPTMLAGYVDCNDRFPYDVDKASELLAEAGWEDGFTVRMRLPKDYQMYVDAGQIIADMLSRVGISCDVEIVEWATWLDEVYTGRDYDMTVVGHTGRLDPITLLARYASDSSENYFNYASDEVDEILALYRTELDESVRAGYVERIQEILADDVPAVYIQDPITTYIASRRIAGFAMYPIDVYEFKDVSIVE